MPVRSVVTFVQPADVDQDHAALAVTFGWAGALSARAVVLAFAVDVTGAGETEEPK
ncbi:MAG: hypothetical protein JNN02_07620, partial [Tabrizicola sp.]|nr:hypothetical protein [Tabrizicola sp.]